MFCNNLCSWFSKNIVSHYRQERLSRQSSYPGQSSFPPDFPFLFIIFLSFEPERIQCWLPIFSSDQERWPCPASRRYWTRGVRSRMSSPNRQPGIRTVDAKYFTSKPPSIRSIDTYVDHRGGYENILFGERRGGGGRGRSPLLHSRLRAEKKRRGAGGDKEIR